MQLYWSPKHLTSTVLMFKVKYEIFSNSVFICCSVLSSILTILLFSNPYLKKQSDARNCKIMQSVKTKVVSIYISHLLSICIAQVTFYCPPLQLLFGISIKFIIIIIIITNFVHNNSGLLAVCKCLCTDFVSLHFPGRRYLVFIKTCMLIDP